MPADKPGRWTGPRAEAPAKPVPIRLSPQELRRACEAAQINHQTVSAFIRDAIVEATEDCLDPLDDQHDRLDGR